MNEKGRRRGVDSSSTQWIMLWMEGEGSAAMGLDRYKWVVWVVGGGAGGVAVLSTFDQLGFQQRVHIVVFRAGCWLNKISTPKATSPQKGAHVKCPPDETHGVECGGGVVRPSMYFCGAACSVPFKWSFAL